MVMIQPFLFYFTKSSHRLPQNQSVFISPFFVFWCYYIVVTEFSSLDYSCMKRKRKCEQAIFISDPCFLFTHKSTPFSQYLGKSYSRSDKRDLKTIMLMPVLKKNERTRCKVGEASKERWNSEMKIYCLTYVAKLSNFVPGWFFFYLKS